jgi:hypothetical protein
MSLSTITRYAGEQIYESDDDLEYETPTQSISGRDIDPVKLKLLLRTKFGAESYDIHIMQNAYCINAPRKLSAVIHIRKTMGIHTDHT